MHPPPGWSCICVLFVLYPYFFVLIILAFVFFFLTVQNPQTSMPPAGYEPAIPAGERPQILALDRSVTGIGGFEPAIPAIE
jgi:hypothetical protein